MDLDIDSLRKWIGKSESQSDQVTPTAIAALSATLDRDDPFPQPGDALPSFWHRMYFLPICRQSELGPDGHSKRGGFLPPVPLPRRMFAGARLQFHHPVRVGDNISRVSRIVDVNYK
jgi:3-methylfumaryl-CoA hydratase